jgi:hypothetical protein
MNNINLLPKVPAIQRVFAPVLLVVVFLFIMTGSMIYFYSFHVRNDITQIQAQTGSDQAIIKQLIQARQIDPLTKDYQAFAAEITKLKNARRDWIPVVEAISGQLPKNSRMQNLSVDDAGSLSGNYEFAGISDVAEYMLGLQHNPLVASIAVKGITRIDKIVNPPSKPANAKAPESKGSSATNTPVGNVASTAATTDAPAVDPIDEMIKMMEQGLVQGKTESDKLLNQLTWMVNEQLVKEKFGVDIKDETALNALKAKQSANKQKASASTPASGSGSVTNSGSGSTPVGKGNDSLANNIVTVYQVALTFALSPPGQAK